MLLPTRTVRLASDLPPLTLAGVLRGLIGGPEAPFAGTAGASGFVITRHRGFGSTFMPRIDGTFAAGSAGGTILRLRLRPPATVAVFMVIWVGFLAAVAALIVIAHARQAGPGLLPVLVPAGLAAFSWYLMTAVFSADAHWAVNHLIEVVPALRVAEPGPGTPAGNPHL